MAYLEPTGRGQQLTATGVGESLFEQEGYGASPFGHGVVGHRHRRSTTTMIVMMMMMMNRPSEGGGKCVDLTSSLFSLSSWGKTFASRCNGGINAAGEDEDDGSASDPEALPSEHCKEGSTRGYAMTGTRVIKESAGGGRREETKGTEFVSALRRRRVQTPRRSRGRG